MRYVTILVLAYVPGFMVVLCFHLFALPMVTLGLALLRSVAWPAWIAFGWPHGSPVLMD
jgi:hypothetical protein